MGAHSTFEQALAGVQAFATAVASESESEERRPKKAKKAKGKKERKEKKERKVSKHKSDGKRKHKKRRRLDSSSGSGSDSEHEAVEVQLERGRAAARTTRQIMAHFPTAKASLRQMFWRLDNREAVGIGSIPDANLRGLLEVLFANLRLLRVSEGVFARRKGGESVLQQLGPVLEEEPAQPSAAAAAAAAPAAPAAAAAAVSPQPAPADARREGVTDSSPEPSEQPGAPAEPGKPSTDVAIGPQMPAGFQPEAAEAEAEPPAQPRRVLGPAMPPRELLSQAAEVAAAMAAEEAEAALIGPPPPELVQQLEGETGDARAAEVLRIARLLDAASEEKPADPYALLGVEPQAEAGAIRKRYWRLSLLIHPDKCGHAQAGRAFEALAQAAKALQDAGARSAIDKRREDAEFAAFAAAEAAKAETARQWRVARGQATAEDLQGPVRAGPAEREEWLTVLPAARRPSAPSQKSQTAFSQQAVAAIGQDASAWTDTPAAKLLRLQQASAAMLPPTADAAQQEKAAATATAVDAYNQSHRGKSLVEQHQERQQQEKRAKKKAKRQEQPEAQQHQQQQPWRPFDRERDLKAPPAGGGDLLKSLGELSSRFGGGKTQRGFL